MEFDEGSVHGIKSACEDQVQLKTSIDGPQQSRILISAPTHTQHLCPIDVER